MICLKGMHPLSRVKDQDQRKLRKRYHLSGKKLSRMHLKVSDLLTTASTLANADFGQPFILHTNASQTGLGAILYQEQDGRRKVIAYASRVLSTSWSHYPVHKLEFWALKWAVTEKFRAYLYGSTFTVLTDNNPLTNVFNISQT